ncbi:MAG: STAS/SEC14 domain-containing protein [Chloroflexota bacterium]
MNSEKKVFEVRQHDNGICELYFYESSRAAVDASVEALDKVLGAREPNSREPFLLMSNNVESGDEPIVYATNAYRKMILRHGAAKLNNTYYALVHRPGAMMAFWTALFSGFRMGVKMRTFTGDQYEEAIAWLQQQTTRVVSGGSDR